MKSTGFFHFTERTDKTNQQGIVVGCNYGSSGATAMVDTGDVHALMIGAAGVGKTAYFLYPNLEYACASGMSFIASDTKGDLFRHYGKIAKEYYGYIVLPEEDSSKHFMVSLIVQQLYREILAVADEYGGKLPNRVMMYLDEFGTIPKISDAEVMFSVSRSRRCSIVAIIQSFAQLAKNYGREGEEIIVDNTQLTVFGGFAPNSESAERLSKSLGTRTVQSGSISRGKNDPVESLQMIERALMTPDELKSLPKGTFVVTKTGAYPMQVKLKLFFEWGIVFPDELYDVPDKGNRMVAYARKEDLQRKMDEIYPLKKTEENESAAKPHHNEKVHRFQKPHQNGRTKDDDTIGGVVMSEENIPNEEGVIYDEGVRDDIPG